MKIKILILLFVFLISLMTTSAFIGLPQTSFNITYINYSALYFFDDFNNDGTGNYNTSKWTGTFGSGGIAEIYGDGNNGILNISGNNDAYYGLKTTTATKKGYCMDFRIMRGTNTANEETFRIGTGTGLGDNGATARRVVVGRDYNNYPNRVELDDGTTSPPINTGTDISSVKFLNYTLVVNDDGSSQLYIDNSYNGNVNSSQTSWATSKYIILARDNDQWLIDYFYVYNCSKGFPVISITPDTTPPTISAGFNISIDNFYKNDVLNFSGNLTDDTALNVANITYNISGVNTYINFTGLSGFSTTVHTVIPITVGGGEVINFSIYAEDSSGNYHLNSTLVTIQYPSAPIVTITSPYNDETLDNVTYPLYINGTATVNGGTVNSTWTDDNNWTFNSGSYGSFGFRMNGTILEYANNVVMIFSNNSNGVVRNSTVYFDTDFTNPLSRTPLSTNNTFYDSNSNLTYTINFTDTRQIYSFNITTPEGYLFNITGLNTTNYIYNGSINISAYNVGVHNITFNFCDAHTKSKIGDWDTSINDYYKEVGFNFGNEYLYISPLYPSLLEEVSIKKQEDRYSLTYKKNEDNKQDTHSFIVLGSESIDIIGNTKEYSGHLVIPKLKKWVDFNTKNKEDLEYEITRINKNLVVVTVRGIEDDTFTFDSVGDLNCMAETYRYYAFNRTVIYNTRVSSNVMTNITLVINKDGIDITSTTASLTYNNTDYSALNISSDTQINYTINITPKRFENLTTIVPFYWNYTINGIKYTTPTAEQLVDSITLDYYGNISNASALNFTLYDEEINQVIKAGEISGTFNYLEGSTFSAEVTNTSNLSISIFPENATATGDFVVYYSATGYPERRHAESTAVYSRNTQVLKLYLLNTTLGGYATFRMVDIYQNALIGVEGNLKRTIGGVLTTVEQQTSDGSGLMSFFVNPDVDYLFTFTKTGYLLYSATIRPITTEIYTITLESESEEVFPPTSVGVTYSITPSNTVLNNDTTYDFTLNLSSDYWDLQNCTLYIEDASGGILNSSSDFTPTGCFIETKVNTKNLDTIISKAEYILNDETNTVLTQYSIKYTYKGNFSLMNFVDDVKAFSNAGFNDFTRMVLVFIVIFSIVAYASSELTGLREPETLIVLSWALVLIFSYLGLLTLNYESIPNVFGQKEWIQQYIIFILFSLGAGSYIIRRHI